MSDPKPTRIGVTLGSTSRNGGEFEFRKISLSLDRDLAALENPLDAFRDVKALLERMVTEFQGPKPTGTTSPAGKTDIHYHNDNPSRPAASKLATLQERLGPRLQNLEVTDGMDGLIVRPRKYLGEAWSQVNEIVRELGGHWQKGNGPKDGAWRIPK
jgi:hypothetical protein